MGNHVGKRLIKCLGQSNDARNILRSSAHGTFLPPTDDHSFDAKGRIRVEKARSFGAVEFVGAARQKVDVQLRQIQGVMPHGLDCIAVEECAVRLAHRPHLPDVQNHPNFIVGMHQSHQSFGLIVGEQLFQMVEVHPPVWEVLYMDHLHPFLSCILRCLDHCTVLRL